MPYVDCPSCGLTAYTAAFWFTVDLCPRCGTDLPRARTGVVSVGPTSRAISSAMPTNEGVSHGPAYSPVAHLGAAQ